MVDMQSDILEQRQRNAAKRFFFSKSDKDQIAAWNRKLDVFLNFLQVRSIGSAGNPRTQQPPFRLS
jgi:hypothetical protein